jgi:hypothetical protein
LSLSPRLLRAPQPGEMSILSIRPNGRAQPTTPASLMFTARSRHRSEPTRTNSGTWRAAPLGRSADIPVAAQQFETLHCFIVRLRAAPLLPGDCERHSTQSARPEWPEWFGLCCNTCCDAVALGTRRPVSTLVRLVIVAGH